MGLTRVLFGISLTILPALTIMNPALGESTNGARSEGFQLYHARRYQEAIAYLDRVIARHPRDIEALLKRGNSYLRLEHPERALPDFEQAIRANPIHPGGYTDRGIALLMLGRNQDALASFSRAVSVWKGPATLMGGFVIPNSAPALSGGKSQQITEGYATAYSGLGQTYHRLGQNEQAIVEYQHAIAINPLDPNAFIGRGDAYAALGQHQSALADYNEAVRLGPDYPRAYSSRGELLAEIGQEEQSLADLDRAIQLDAGFAHAYSLRGALLSQRGQNDRALADYDAVIRLSPERPGGYKDRGGVLVRLGRFQRAIPDLDKAITLDPKRSSAYLNRGAAYSSLGHYERAIDDLNKAITLDPKNAAAHSNIGLAYYMIGQYDRSIEDLSEAVRLAPENAVTHLNRGNVFARLGFREQAIRDYETASRLNPRLIASYGGTAKLLEEMGRQSLAVKNDQWPQQPDPTESSLAYERGNAHRSRGDWQGAIADFSQVIALEPNRADAYVARGWSRLCAGEPGGENDARAYLRIEGYRTRVSLYMTILGYLSARWAGNAAEAQAFLEDALGRASASQATWPAPILRYFRREISAAALLKAATTDSQQTEAHAFLALDLLQNGDRSRASEHLRWVRDQGVAASIAGDLARATLARINLAVKSGGTSGP
jgi:tetratricopeptide (TPR) repeat protein